MFDTDITVYVGDSGLPEFSVLASMWQDFGKEEPYRRVVLLPNARVYYIIQSNLTMEDEDIVLSCVDDHLDHVPVEDEYYDQSCTCEDHVINDRECYNSTDECFPTRVKTAIYYAHNVSIAVRYVEEDND